MVNREILTAWRKAKGWSQAEAAEKLGAKQRTWAGWEIGESHPEMEYAFRLEELTEGQVIARDWRLSPLFPRKQRAANPRRLMERSKPKQRRRAAA